MAGNLSRERVSRRDRNVALFEWRERWWCGKQAQSILGQVQDYLPPLREIASIASPAALKAPHYMKVKR